LFARREWKFPHGGIETALAINAIERADFGINRQKIDTQRKSQPAAVNGSEYYLVEKYHKLPKNSLLSNLAGGIKICFSFRFYIKSNNFPVGVVLKKAKQPKIATAKYTVKRKNGNKKIKCRLIVKENQTQQ